MSSDNEVSQLRSPVQYNTDTFLQEPASDGPHPPGGDRQGGGGLL